MKRRKKLLFIVCILGMVLAVTLYGCKEDDQTGLTKDEPEITVDYLAGEYAEQLVRDGAEHVFGSFVVEKGEDGTVTLNIDAKEYVVDDSKPNGFYVADRNMNVSYVLAPEARTTFLSGGSSIATIMTAEEFITAVADDLLANETADSDYTNKKLYDMYVLNGQIQLVIAKYIP